MNAVEAPSGVTRYWILEMFEAYRARKARPPIKNYARGNMLVM